MDLLLGVLQLISVFAGALMVYGSLFLYEADERQIQNILEIWWIRIDDARKSATATHTAVTRAAANLARSALNRLFGKRLISLRAISVSGLLSLASFHFTAIYLSDWSEKVLATDITRLDLKTPPEQAVAALVMFFVAFGRLLIVLAVPDRPLFMHAASLLGLAMILPSAASKRFARLPQVYFLILAAFFAGLAMFARPAPSFVGLPYMVLVAVSAGIVFDFLCIAVIRWLVAQQTGWTSIVDTAAAAMLELLMGLGLLVGPIYLGLKIMRAAQGAPWYAGLAGWSVLLSTLTNVGSAIISFSFFAALTALAIHRVFWPLIERPLYQLARLGLFKSVATKTALFALGVSTAAVGLGRGDDIASFFVRLLQAG